MSAEHPNIKNFKSAIQNNKIDDEKLRNFEKWMNNPAKFPEELRSEAEALLAQARKGAHGAIPGAFHNPYTFIPFPKSAPERHKPTPLTIDEIETDRMTGIIDVELKTLSPLLSPEHKKTKRGEKAPKSFKAAKWGNDVIVPASSIRGMLRSLCAIVSGSALDYIDDNLWLCQGRDANLSAGKGKVFLAVVVKPGNAYHSGIIRVGEAHLVKSQDLGFDCRSEKREQYNIRGAKELWIDDPDSLSPRCQDHEDSAHPYRVKVSGCKIPKDKDWEEKQHEGVFKPSCAVEIEVPSRIWMDYCGRNRHGQRPVLEENDIIWVQPVDPAKEPASWKSEDIQSLQWARWGKTGVRFADSLKKLRLGHMLPDYVKNDGLVDITSDLFGSIPLGGDSYEAIASRVRPENLVFPAARTFENELPPLSSPHPGCKAFYIDNQRPGEISLEDLPRGYKVYRTSKEHGDKAPWHYAVQPEYVKCEAKAFSVSDMAKKAELVAEDVKGSLKIAFRALNREELSLLLLLLSCDLRIGGGKPLGLGHCVVSSITLRDEMGDEFFSYVPERAAVPEEFADAVPPEYLKRAKIYCKTQEPVDMLRYPRAYSSNGNQHGGMCWFQEFASPKKSSKANEVVSKGLQTVKIASSLRGKFGEKAEIPAQMLPKFDPSNPESDWLFGYDVQCVKSGYEIQEFREISGTVKPETEGRYYENTSLNRQKKQEERNKRQKKNW
ncbi:MAG: hypothetical protein IJV93_08765 [Lentisphaeria bacterium]|nr:hypothetical protein [Lentisphaeria bacterium]